MAVDGNTSGTSSNIANPGGNITNNTNINNNSGTFSFVILFFD